jgi:hypothetical protein
MGGTAGWRTAAPGRRFLCEADEIRKKTVREARRIV